MKTNELFIVERKKYLLPFLNTILQKRDGLERKIVNNLYRLCEILISKAPKDYYPKSKLEQNEFQINLPTYRGANKNLYYIEKDGQKIIVKFIYDSFAFIFIQFMLESNNEFSIEDRVNLFIEKYMENNLDYDHLLKKRWQRFRYSEKKSNKTKKTT